ncbi:MAG: hypothetical protein KAW92_05280 [Candidatus Cloacimonetes bacterium]|nr:hypothetical protein [Candidatus Cloacimonadota bacterium]
MSRKPSGEPKHFDSGNIPEPAMGIHTSRDGFFYTISKQKRKPFTASFLKSEPKHFDSGNIPEPAM